MTSIKILDTVRRMKNPNAAGLELAIAQAGGVTRLAVALGLQQSTVSMWRRRGQIPAERVPKVSAATGIPGQQLRPDLYNTHIYKEC